MTQNLRQDLITIALSLLLFLMTLNSGKWRKKALEASRSSTEEVHRALALGTNAIRSANQTFLLYEKLTNWQTQLNEDRARFYEMRPLVLTNSWISVTMQNFEEWPMSPAYIFTSGLPLMTHTGLGWEIEVVP